MDLPNDGRRRDDSGCKRVLVVLRREGRRDIKGLPQKFNDGHSEITIDNGRNNSDMFVKVVAVHDNALGFPIRQLFLPAHGSFTVKNVRPGPTTSASKISKQVPS